MGPLYTDVAIDGCVVYVASQRCSDGTVLIVRYLERDPWELMEFCWGRPELTLRDNHEWACDPKSCARAVMRYRNSGNRSNHTYRRRDDSCGLRPMTTKSPRLLAGRGW
jgi:hypothetical protein